MKRFLIAISIISISAAYACAADNSHIYSTGKILEIDRCASAWLIKRFIDKDAEFKFFPDGELIKVGISFDTPDAELTRSHNMSTFEVIASKYKISHKGVKHIAKMMHDIEVNFWGKKQFEESIIFEKEINQIINQSTDNNECLEKCFAYFDALVAGHSEKNIIKEKSFK